MEARHVEVERFAKKARSYKMALQLAPHARELELRAVAAILRGVCQARGWQPAQVRVVDLMAGNGALSGALRLAGFQWIKAVEACKEMLPEGNVGVEFVNGGAFADIRNFLQGMRPHIIVSLAGFHHLIERAGKDVDRKRSVVTQAVLAGACVDALEPDGVLLVVDLVEDEDFDRLGLSGIWEWEGTAFQGIESCSYMSGSDLTRTRSLKGYEAVIRQWFGDNECGGTLKWFREFVDPKTVVGHDDVAISAELLQILKLKYGGSLFFAKFRCPWLFRDADQAVEFVLQKFGFYVERTAREVQRQDVEAGMRRYLDFPAADDGRPCALAWNLGAWMVRAPKNTGNQRATLTILLLCFSVIMYTRTGVRFAAGAGVGIDLVLSGGTWLVTGMVAGMLVDHLKRKL